MAEVVVDPTLLLERDMYEELIKNCRLKKSYQLFSYMLHKNQKTAEAINDYIFNKYFDRISDKKYNQEPISITEWLYNIKNSRFVLTNSFHGLVFALIFHTPFIAVPVFCSGSAMNDRVATILKSVGLENRIVNEFNEKNIDKIMKEDIDWKQVDNKIQQLKEKSGQFLIKAIEGSLN